MIVRRVLELIPARFMPSVVLLLYFFIGATAALVNLGVFALLLNGFSMQYNWAIICSYIASAAANYLLCIAILFRHKARWTTTGELLAYIVTLLIMGAVDYAMTLLLINWLKAPLTGKLLASIVGFFGNYFLRKNLVFPLKKQ